MRVAGNGGYWDMMEVAWVGCGGGQSQGGTWVRAGDTQSAWLRAGVWIAGHQRVGCGRQSEHGECDKTMQLWVGQHRGHVMQVGRRRCGTASRASQGEPKPPRQKTHHGWTATQASNSCHSLQPQQLSWNVGPHNHTNDSPHSPNPEGKRRISD